MPNLLLSDFEFSLIDRIRSVKSSGGAAMILVTPDHQAVSSFHFNPDEDVDIAGHFFVTLASFLAQTELISDQFGNSFVTGEKL